MHDFEDITLVLTSCRRPDLLERTVNSMHPWVSRFPCKLIVEDDPVGFPFLDTLERDGWLVLRTDAGLGQHKSIDRAYAQVVTRFVFHCEDDWHFTRQPDLRAAKAMFDASFPGDIRVSNVSFHCSSTDLRYLQDNSVELNDGATTHAYLRAHTRKHRYLYFSFTPSLIEHDLWRSHGPWGTFLSEGSIARFLKARGYRRVFQRPVSCHHIGRDRHVHDRTRRKSLSAVVAQWLRHRV